MIIQYKNTYCFCPGRIVAPLSRFCPSGLAQKEAYLTELLLKAHSTEFASLSIDKGAGSLDVKRFENGNGKRGATPLA